MKKYILILIFFSSIGVYAQDYQNAIGIRGGITQGITFKHFFKTADAGDFVGAFYRGGMYVMALYERHQFDIFDVDNLAFFYGGGLHVGYFDGNSNLNWFSDPEQWGSYHVVFGVDLVVGVEYTFDEIPLNISLDIKPAVNFIGHFGYWQGGALSVRYIFGSTTPSL
jgi:hypothetical protein